MLYSEEQIQTVLWNVLGDKVNSIRLLDDYTFGVTFPKTTTYMQISDLLGELIDTDLFDIENKGSIDDDGTQLYILKYIGEDEVLEFHQHRFFYNILENASNFVEFEDSMIKRWTTLYNMQHIKYHSGFFKSIFDQLIKNKRLTKKQYDEFKFLLDNGKSRYEAGVLSTKN